MLKVQPKGSPTPAQVYVPARVGCRPVRPGGQPVDENRDEKRLMSRTTWRAALSWCWLLGVMSALDVPPVRVPDEG